LNHKEACDCFLGFGERSIRYHLPPGNSFTGSRQGGAAFDFALPVQLLEPRRKSVHGFFDLAGSEILVPSVVSEQ
jgi:hypothetical protein